MLMANLAVLSTGLDEAELQPMLRWTEADEHVVARFIPPSRWSQVAPLPEPAARHHDRGGSHPGSGQVVTQHTKVDLLPVLGLKLQHHRLLFDVVELFRNSVEVLDFLI